MPVIRQTKLAPNARGYYERSFGGKKIDLGKDEVQAAINRRHVTSIYIQNALMQAPHNGSPHWLPTLLDIA